jgi:hypothetical protein
VQMSTGEHGHNEMLSFGRRRAGRDKPEVSEWPILMSSRLVTDLMKVLFPAPVTPISAITLSSNAVRQQARPNTLNTEFPTPCDASLSSPATIINDCEG